MNENNEKILHFKKVHLSLETGRTHDSMDLTLTPLRFDFIYGLGIEGLTPFEYELAERAVGETFVLSVSKGHIPELFGHLAFQLPALPEESEPFYMRIGLLRMSPVDPREIIRSMAETTGCGDHCCGEH